MTDRELLEMAAKAAGIDGEYRTERLCIAGDWLDVTAIFYDGGMRWWNPLEDDGDALRLAVTLGIDFYMGAGDVPEAWAGYYMPGRENKKHACEPVNGDPYAATRRAITRAAAEIGKGMK